MRYNLGAINAGSESDVAVRMRSFAWWLKILAHALLKTWGKPCGIGRISFGVVEL